MILTTDLDNTLIFSYKRDIGSVKRCVELYNGREISFITNKTYELLKKVKNKMLIVPVTTRTVEQYKRIDLGIGDFPYALVCNGGVMLRNGEEDIQWYKESTDRIADSIPELKKAVRLLEKDLDVCFEIRFIRELFVFTKSNTPAQTAQRLREQLDPDKAEVFTNGMKVYAVPNGLNKGTAVQRLKAFLGENMVIAAGDSEFDIPMLKSSDHAVCPSGLEFSYNGKITFCGNDELLSECMLNTALLT